MIDSRRQLKELVLGSLGDEPAPVGISPLTA